ncbi:MAG: hypothetical protein IK086_01375, partial [Clostridia bacterium]|nr:hypothetical protein [Clostridia bacterium]
MKKRISVKLLSILLAVALISAMLPLGIFTVSAETAIDAANITVNIPSAGEYPDFSPVSDDEERYYTEVESWYLYEAPYPHLDGDSTFEAGNTYALRVRFEAQDGYEFAEDAVFTINGNSTACYGAKNNREFIFTVPETTFDVSTPQELYEALNKQTPVEAINIVADMTLFGDYTINYDEDHLENYQNTVLTVNEGVTVTLDENGALGSDWPSYTGDWEDPPFPDGKVINNGTVIIKNRGAIVADFDENNGTVIVEAGGSCVCPQENYGTITVHSGGTYATSQGQQAENHNTVDIEEGAVMESRFGSTIVNCDDGTINLNGTFNCACVGFDGDAMWFENQGTVNGNGEVYLYEADRDVAPVADMDALIEEMMAALGQETRFENWDDIGIYKYVEVRTYEELAAALPGNRVVAGEEVAGDMDVKIIVTADIEFPENAAI